MKTISSDMKMSILELNLGHLWVTSPLADDPFTDLM